MPCPLHCPLCTFTYLDGDQVFHYPDGIRDALHILARSDTLARFKEARGKLATAIENNADPPPGIPTLSYPISINGEPYLGFYHFLLDEADREFERRLNAIDNWRHAED